MFGKSWPTIRSCGEPSWPFPQSSLWEERGIAGGLEVETEETMAETVLEGIAEIW
jgi:hypothetical protein